MTESLDAVMQDASQKLVDMDYLACEQRCLDALALARARGDWTYYARILMPLQEARRQRRMTALDTAVQLGTSDGYPPHFTGCLLLSPPHDRDDAKRLTYAATADHLHFEALLSLSDTNETHWTLSTFQGPEVTVEVQAPADVPLNEVVDPAAHPDAGAWFIAAFEALGDAALETVTAPLGSFDRVMQLEALVAAVGDHEILHQRLGDAARAMPVEPVVTDSK